MLKPFLHSFTERTATASDTSSGILLNLLIDEKIEPPPRTQNLIFFKFYSVQLICSPMLIKLRFWGCVPLSGINLGWLSDWLDRHKCIQFTLKYHFKDISYWWYVDSFLGYEGGMVKAKRTLVDKWRGENLLLNQKHIVTWLFLAQLSLALLVFGLRPLYFLISDGLVYIHSLF